MGSGYAIPIDDTASGAGDVGEPGSDLGADSCMWAADFPHTDSTFPNSRRSIEETLGMLPDRDRRKITALNCAKLYGFEYAA